jgi:hypothetical protein
MVEGAHELVNHDAIAAPAHSEESIAGRLAVLFLEEAIENGGQVEIPSLGIKIAKEDLPESA